MQIEDAVCAQAYVRYRGKVFGYLCRRLSSRHDAEDLTSEVFLRLLSVPDGFDLERPGAASYIFRTMQSVLTDFYRKRGVPFVPLEEIADETVSYDERLDELAHALDVLNEREQAVVILHYYHGLSHREIAEKMHLSYVNVRQICHTALRKLRQEMSDL